MHPVVNERGEDQAYLVTFNLGKLQEFDIPRILEAENKDLARLILTFCLIYNDFKDLFLFDAYLERTARHITDANPQRQKAQNGQISGMREHLRRILTAGMLELLVLIKENEQVLRSDDFTKLTKMVKKVYSGFDDDWQGLWNLALGQPTSDIDSAFRNALVKIRNNGAYHYKQTKSLFDGLRHYCADRGKTGYVSEGNTLEKTRFYFADAAIQSYARNVMASPEYHDAFAKHFDKYMRKINNVLYFVTLVYLTHFLRIDLRPGT